MDGMLSTRLLSASFYEVSLLNRISRRSFLKLVGVAAVGLPFQSVLSKIPVDPIRGRALIATPVYTGPSPSLVPVSHLWPDSIVTISDVLDDWYQVEQGYVLRHSLQPMTLFEPQVPAQTPATPFWAEVAGPAVSVRQHCAADAPLVTRIGHGGVCQIVDLLPGEPNGWYRLADGDGQMIGWSQAVFWRAVETEPMFVPNMIVRIDPQNCQLTITKNGEPVLSAPCAIGESLLPGHYYPARRRIGGVQTDVPAPFHGVPWVTTFGDSSSIAGVYWHNRFGQLIDGPAVQVTPLLAQWIYSSVGEIVVE